MAPYGIIIIIFGVIALLLISLLFFVNRLTLLKNKIEFTFEPVNSYIEERIELLEKMSTFLSKRFPQETELNKKIDKVHDSLKKIKNASDGITELKNSENVFQQFQKLEELMPNIKKNEEFVSFKEEYQNNQDKISYALEKYNKEVKDYNNYKEKKVVSLLNKVFRFPNYSYYKKEL